MYGWTTGAGAGECYTNADCLPTEQCCFPIGGGWCQDISVPCWPGAGGSNFYIVSTNPYDGQQLVSLCTAITVRFSLPVDPADGTVSDSTFFAIVLIVSMYVWRSSRSKDDSKSFFV